MPTFEHPPEWWGSLANLTQWLYWPAISAFVAGAAWWRTGSLADQARREARRKDAAFVMAIAVLFEGAVQAYRRSVLDCREGMDVKPSFEAAQNTATATAFAKRLADVKVTDVPTATALTVFLSAEVKLRQIEVFAGRLSSGQQTNAEVIVPAILRLQNDIKVLVQIARDLTDEEVVYEHEDYLEPLTDESVHDDA